MKKTISVFLLLVFMVGILLPVSAYADYIGDDGYAYPGDPPVIESVVEPAASRGVQAFAAAPDDAGGQSGTRKISVDPYLGWGYKSDSSTDTSTSRVRGEIELTNTVTGSVSTVVVYSEVSIPVTYEQPKTADVEAKIAEAENALRSRAQSRGYTVTADCSTTESVLKDVDNRDEDFAAGGVNLLIWYVWGDCEKNTLYLVKMKAETDVIETYSPPDRSPKTGQENLLLSDLTLYSCPVS